LAQPPEQSNKRIASRQGRRSESSAAPSGAGTLPIIVPGGFTTG
jgi:hypothetical protein